MVKRILVPSVYFAFIVKILSNVYLHASFAYRQIFSSTPELRNRNQAEHAVIRNIYINQNNLLMNTDSTTLR